MQMVHTSLGPCLRGHNTWACLNVSLEFAFSSEVRLNFDVAVFEGTLKSLGWCVNCQLAEFTQRGLRMRSSPTLPPVWSLFSFWGDKRELRRLGWEVVFGDCRVLFCFFSSLGESEIHVRVQIQVVLITCTVALPIKENHGGAFHGSFAIVLLKVSNKSYVYFPPTLSKKQHYLDKPSLTFISVSLLHVVFVLSSFLY